MGLQELAKGPFLAAGLVGRVPVVEEDHRLVADEGAAEVQRLPGRGVEIAVHHDDAGLLDPVLPGQRRAQCVREEPLDQVRAVRVHARLAQPLAGELDLRAELPRRPDLLPIGLCRQTLEGVEAEDPGLVEPQSGEGAVHADHRVALVDPELQIVADPLGPRPFGETCQGLLVVALESLFGLPPDRNAEAVDERLLDPRLGPGGQEQPREPARGAEEPVDPERPQEAGEAVLLLPRQGLGEGPAGGAAQEDAGQRAKPGAHEPVLVGGSRRDGGGGSRRCRQAGSRS